MPILLEEQVVPVYPTGQVHVYLLRELAHVAPFRQGSLWQLSITETMVKNVKLFNYHIINLYVEIFTRCPLKKLLTILV